MKSITMNEVFYGWKAGTSEVDEKGNTSIDVNCDTVESVIDEIDFLIETEKVKKRGFLKQLHFIINSIGVEITVYGNVNREYDVISCYTDKCYHPSITTKLDIETALNHVKKIIECF